MKLLVIAEKNLAELKMLSQLPSQVTINIETDLDKIKTLATTTDAVLLCNWKGNKETLQEILKVNPKIKGVHTWWTGVDSLVFPELKNYPLTLTNARGVYAEPLAEFVIAACIYFAKDFPRMLKNKMAAVWEQFESELIYGKTLGIFGYGEIGKSIAKRASALGMNVIAVRKRKDQSLNDPYLKQILSFEEANILFKNSDYLVAAAPLTKETKYFINKSSIALMKPTATLINVGRGPVIKEIDLIEALKIKRIKGAALDVFEVEPLSKDSPLWTLENVLLSPHIADRNSGWLNNSMQCFIDNCQKFLNQQKLENIVNLELGY